MDAIQILITQIHLEGEWAFVYSFSAKSISEAQDMSRYKASKLLKALREYGLIHRNGNRYMFTIAGWNIAHDVIRAAGSVTSFKGGVSND